VEAGGREVSGVRNMSFFATQKQILEQTKTVTRRTGWKDAKPGDILQPIVKGQGLKKGETIQKLGCPIRIVSVTLDALREITDEDVAREGFPGQTREWFIDLFCKINPQFQSGFQPVRRIEFEYLETWSDSALKLRNLADQGIKWFSTAEQPDHAVMSHHGPPLGRIGDLAIGMFCVEAGTRLGDWVAEVSCVGLTLECVCGSPSWRNEFRFSESQVDEILRTFPEHATHWNGVGCGTMTIVLPCERGPVFDCVERYRAGCPVHPKESVFCKCDDWRNGFGSLNRFKSEVALAA
jgi:hypothetical protein